MSGDVHSRTPNCIDLVIDVFQSAVFPVLTPNAVLPRRQSARVATVPTTLPNVHVTAFPSAGLKKLSRCCSSRGHFALPCVTMERGLWYSCARYPVPARCPFLRRVGNFRRCQLFFTRSGYNQHWFVPACRALQHARKCAAAFRRIVRTTRQGKCTKRPSMRSMKTMMGRRTPLKS